MWKKIKFWFQILVETVFYLIMSSLPLWITILCKQLMQKNISDSASSILAGFVSVCIPILFFGFSAFSPKGDEEKSSWLWKISILAYTIAVVIFIIIGIFDAAANILIVWIFSGIIFVSTFISCFHQRKYSMLKKFKPEDSRQEELNNAEKGVFDD